MQLSALSQHGAEGLGGFPCHGIGGVGKFERRLRAAVPEKPADREDGFALSQRQAGMGVAEVMKARTFDAGFVSDPIPDGKMVTERP